MSYELTKPYQQTPVRSMREVDSIEQLEWILSSAYDVVKLRDDIYNSRNEIASIRTNYYQTRTTTRQKVVWGFYSVLLPIFPGGLGFSMARIPGFIIGYIIGVLLYIAITRSSIRHDREKEEHYKMHSVASEKKIKDFEDKARQLTGIVWCAEIIPIEYRNQRAIDIMLSAIRNSRADNWRECLDIYDKECQKDSMRRYQEEQLALSREAARNSGIAAAGAWAAFGAILWK